MKSVLSLGLLAAIVGLTGCATPATPAAGDANQDEKIYVTGSNLPQRDRKAVKTVDPDSVKNEVRPGAPTSGNSGTPR